MKRSMQEVGENNRKGKRQIKNEDKNMTYISIE